MHRHWKRWVRFLAAAAVLLSVGAAGCQSSGGASDTDRAETTKRQMDSSTSDETEDAQHDISADRGGESRGRRDDTTDAETGDGSADGHDSAGPSYLALGDSYTIGTNVARSSSFPVQLVEHLRQEGIPFQDPMIIGRVGWTTENLDAGIAEAEIDGRTFDLVTLLIGVNNQFQGWSPSQFRPEFVELVDRAVTFAGDEENRVIVISIPDYSVTPFGQRNEPEQTAEELEAFNAIVREEAKKAGVHYVNITDISRRAADNADSSPPTTCTRPGRCTPCGSTASPPSSGTCSRSRRTRPEAVPMVSVSCDLGYISPLWTCLTRYVRAVRRASVVTTPLRTNEHAAPRPGAVATFISSNPPELP